MTVEVFSVGFGRPLASWYDKHGTQWKIGWMPLGGYVKFLGDENAASAPDIEAIEKMDAQTRKTTLFDKPLGQRAAVVAAGPVANFILAIIIFAGLYAVLGQRVTDPVVGAVVADSAAERAGFQPGDLITAIDDTRVETFAEVRRIVTVNADTELMFEIRRDGELLVLPATPDWYLETDSLAMNSGLDGWAFRWVLMRPMRAMCAIIPSPPCGWGSRKAISLSSRPLPFWGALLPGAKVLKVWRAHSHCPAFRASRLAGAGSTHQFNGCPFGQHWAINLFDPMLDGGHLMFYAYEAVAGKPMPERVQEVGMRIGLSLVLALFVFVTWNDITR